jgi:nanoRNase/pAp phosphatase (c-di-AMP/oligoRNAs hydrolase)
MYIRSHRLNRDAFDSLMLLSMDEMAQAGGMMRLYYNAQLEAHKKRQPMYVNFNDQSGLALNADAAFSSELGHYLAEKSKTFGAVYQVEGTKIKFSLRSCGDYDVSALAKIFGGGGHKNAAGFTCAADVFFLEDGVL